MLGTLPCVPQAGDLQALPVTSSGTVLPAQQLRLEVQSPGLSCLQALASAVPSAGDTSSPPPSTGVRSSRGSGCVPSASQHSLSKEVEALLCTGCCEGGEVRSDGICELNKPGPSPHDVARKTDSQVVSKQEHVSSWIVAQLAQLWESCGGCREGVGV